MCIRDRFQDIPSFYQISISNPNHPILKEIEYQKLKSIFYDYLETTSISENENSAEQYHNELTRLKKKLGKLSIFKKQVNIIDKKLFSYKVNLPKKIFVAIGAITGVALGLYVVLKQLKKIQRIVTFLSLIQV